MNMNMKERDAFKENLQKMNKHYLDSQQKLYYCSIFYLIAGILFIC